MNYLARAWRNVSRKITKSILLAITFFMIGNLVILGLGVSQAAENAKILTRKKMKAVINYEVDYDAYFKYLEGITDQTELEEAEKNYPTLDKEYAFELTKDKHVKALNYMQYSYVYSVGFENVPLGNENLKGENISFEVDENGEKIEYQSPNIAMFTNIFPSMIEFEDKTNEIIEGSFYSQQHIDDKKMVAVISKELADINNIKVGDTIAYNNFGNNNYYKEILEKEGYKPEDFNHDLEVIGIYSTLRNVDPNSENFKYMEPFESPKNFIYIPGTSYAQTAYDDYLKIYQARKGQGSLYEGETEPALSDFEAPAKVVYLLDDPLNVDDFVKRNSTNIKEFTILNANNETFKTLSRPLDTLSFFANVIVWIVTVNAIVIISLVTALTLKTRESEIGVLLSLGVSKFKVVLQLFMELIIVAILGFTAAIISGSAIAGKVGDSVLQFQQSKEVTAEEDIWDTGWSDPSDYFTSVDQDQLFAEYKVSVSPIIIIQIYVFGLSVVFVSILIPSAMIMRLNPKQILLSSN